MDMDAVSRYGGLAECDGIKGFDPLVGETNRRSMLRLYRLDPMGGGWRNFNGLGGVR